MAVNKAPWQRNDGGALKPLVLYVAAAAGSTRTIKKGEICTITGGVLIPAASGDTTDLVVANQEQKSSDVARHIECIVPRPDDLFEFELTASRAIALGETLSISDSETLQYAVSNVVARVASDWNYPSPEEKSTTKRSLSYAEVYFDEQASYLSELTGNS